MKNVSIVIPSYNSQDTIAVCIEAIKMQKTRISYETIVVDCTPGNEIGKIVSGYPDIIFIKENARFNPGPGRNIGAKFARGELIVFIDSDIVISEDFIEKAFEYYNSGHYVFCGSIDVFDKKYLDFSAKLEYFLEFAEFKPLMKEGTRWCLPSCALAIKKQIFQEALFVDLLASEDVDLTVRLREQGNELYFNPNIRSFHVFHTGLIGLFKKFFIFGETNAHIRFMHNITGSKLLKNKILAFFCIPLFTGLKLIKNLWRNVVFNKFQDKIFYLIMLPLEICILLSWMIGFYKKVLFREAR